jgi:hypothetical protein
MGVVNSINAKLEDEADDLIKTNLVNKASKEE